MTAAETVDRSLVTQASARDSIVQGVRELWAQTLGDPEICVAVLDGPVDLSHPCLNGAMLETVGGPAESPGISGPAAAHGLHVCSVIFGQHSGAVKGITPNCRGLIVPVFRDRDRLTIEPCSQITLAQAILQALEKGAHIINISGGQFSESGKAHCHLEQAVRQCAEADVLVLAAAGNDGCRCLHVPGALRSVLAIGAMDALGEPLKSSNWGYSEEGILAPGKDIVGAATNGGTEARTGTSFATAVTSGVAALLMSLQRRAGVRPSGSLIRDVLIQTADPCDRLDRDTCDQLLAGRLNVRAAAAFINQTFVKQQGTVMTHSQPTPLSAEGPAAPVLSETGVLCAASNETPDDFASSEQAQVVAAGAEDSFDGGQAQTSAAAVAPSACGCGGTCGGKGASPPQKVFVLGRLSFDYGTRSRRLWFGQSMRNTLNAGQGPLPNVDDPETLFNYLTKRAAEGVNYTILEGQQFLSRANVTAFHWVLTIDDTPVYAIAPTGPFAFEIHDTLVGFLSDQLHQGAERISVAGLIAGEAKLFFGETVPLLVPDVRGMFSWTTSALVGATNQQEGTEPPHRGRRREADAPPAAAGSTETMEDFLNRVYDQVRNLGITSQERALNYAVTDALFLRGIFNDTRSSAKYQGYELDTFGVTKSPICRPDFDCWDVQIIFYDPNNLQRARRGFRFTVDVSDVMPVMIGERKEYSFR
jgi:cyanobactin maturation PatA/PatG family protease